MDYLDNEFYEAHILSFVSAVNVHKAFGVVEETLYSFLVILHWAAASLSFFFLNINPQDPYIDNKYVHVMYVKSIERMH